MAEFFTLITDRGSTAPCFERFKTYEAALACLKERLAAEVPFGYELKCIRGDRDVLGEKLLPAPRYRSSVFAYFDHLFRGAGFPTHAELDLTDYHLPQHLAGDLHSLHTYLAEYPLDALRDVCMDGSFPFTAYERDLGFGLFANGQRLFFCSALGPRSVLTITQGKEDDEYLLNLHFERTNPAYPPFSRSFTILKKAPAGHSLKTISSLMVLLELLHATAPLTLPALIKAIERRYCVTDVLLLAEQPPLLDKTCERTLLRHVQLLRALGYPIRTDGNYGYYLPPTIAREDAEAIRTAILQAGLSDSESYLLLRKLKTVCGARRYSQNGEIGAPAGPIRNKWKSAAYPVLVWNTLCLHGKELPMYSADPEKVSLQTRIEQLYGTRIDRKAISRSIDNLTLMGFPVKKSARNVGIELSLCHFSIGDLKIITHCVQSDPTLSEKRKEQLTKALFAQIPHSQQ